MKPEYKAVGSYGTLGIEIVLSVLLPSALGYWADHRFNTGMTLLLVGFCLGLATAGKAVHRTWQEMQKDTAREEREQGNPAPMFEKPDDKADKGSSRGKDAPISPKDDDASS